eukprot:c5558_g1_i1.p1 GENE.c5558_g1_i1~~c5558_g1_i1.p1  ORF type:complete len:123 (+),score=26.49 c5558_g1_i1:30-371(+)
MKLPPFHSLHLDQVHVFDFDFIEPRALERFVLSESQLRASTVHSLANVISGTSSLLSLEISKCFFSEQCDKEKQELLEAMRHLTHLTNLNLSAIPLTQPSNRKSTHEPTLPMQ